MYALEEYANDMDSDLVAKQFKRMQYLSYKCSSPAQRVAAMYYNEMVNVKSSFEILYNANLEDDVTHEGKTKALEDLLIEQEENSDKLFIAME